MTKYIHYVILILIIASSCNENDFFDLHQDISGIYNATFTGTYVINTHVYDWNREQLMKISKINDRMFSVCVYYNNSCISNTTTVLRRINKNQIEGLYYYQKTHSSDWQVDTLSGNIEDTRNSCNTCIIKGIFEAETVQKILVESGPYTYPSYITVPVQGTFIFTKSK